MSVLVLFTVALVAGQARANLPNEIKAAPITAITTSVNIVLNTDALQKLEALPLFVDTLLALPTEIKGASDSKFLSPFDAGEQSPHSTSE